MDGALWLWSGGRGFEMGVRQSGPVSQVAIDPASGHAVTASYDKSVCIWDVSGARGRQLCSLSGHSAPVLELCCGPGGRIATGERRETILHL